MPPFANQAEALPFVSVKRKCPPRRHRSGLSGGRERADCQSTRHHQDFDLCPPTGIPSSFPAVLAQRLKGSILGGTALQNTDYMHLIPLPANWISLRPSRLRTRPALATCRKTSATEGFRARKEGGSHRQSDSGGQSQPIEIG
jgi:hypothetical protein